MAKNKEVFEYQAKISVDMSHLGNQIGAVKKALKETDVNLKLPKHFISDLTEIENKFYELQKSAPGAGSSSKDILKYVDNFKKLGTQINNVSGKMKNFTFSDEAIRSTFEDLQKLSKEIESINRKLNDDFNERAEKVTRANTKAYGYKEIKDQREAAIKEARSGYAGATAASKFKNIKENIAARRVQIENWNPEAKEKEETRLKLAEENIALIEREITALRKLQQSRLTTAKKLGEELETGTQTRKQETTTQFLTNVGSLDNVVEQGSRVVDVYSDMADEAKKNEEAAKAFDLTSQKIKNLFSATTVFYTVRRVVQGAIRDFQELDKQFNEIAIVSDYSTEEMWKSFSSVNKIAQEFGVTTKNVLEVQNLYYHQGKDMAEVNKLTAQTLTLAKITGMDYERATSDLTAALNAYNIAAEDAVLVTDSIAAMDTNAAISSEELMTALTKTASIAANAGMSLQSTEVFLTKMIETTREAPENLGTALKTIIARFGEVKEEIDGEEIELADVNKVDAALKSIGISLLDTAGQIRDLDDVFMELSAKWDDLDRNTQRYIATQAAGSRQQSRFIAMMEDYDRTLELTEIAQNSAGLGARQLAESMDSIETSMNRLKSTWQEFYANIINAGWIKGGIDAANGLLTLLNKLPGPTGAIVAAFALWGIKTLIVDKALTNLGKAIGDNIGKSQVLNQLLGTTDKLNTESNQTWFQKAMALAAAEEALEEYNEELAENTAQQLANNAVQGQFGENGSVVFSDVPDNNQNPNQPPVNIPVQPTFSKYLYQELAKNLKNTKGQKFFSEAAEGGLSKALTSSIEKGGLIQKLTGAITKIIPTIIKFLPVIAAIVAALWVANKVWKEFFKGSTDDTEQLEKLTKAQEEYNNAQKEYNDLKQKQKTIEKYRNRTIKSAEEIQEEQEAIKALVDEYPNLLESIDEEGNYHIKNAQAIQEEIDKKRELLELNGQEYTLMRTTFARQGIYSDENTLAGASMKHLKDFYATAEEDTIKDIAKKLDREGVFNSTLFKEFAEAYASGEKTSFGRKDFSNLFAGTITSDKDWDTLVQVFKENFEDLGAEGALGKALETIGYSEQNIEETVEMWKLLNEETGNLYNNLLQGIGEEVKEITVQEAELYVNEITGNKENVPEQLKNALEEYFADYKEKRTTEINDTIDKAEQGAAKQFSIPVWYPSMDASEIQNVQVNNYLAQIFSLEKEREEANKTATKDAEAEIQKIWDAITANTDTYEDTVAFFENIGEKTYNELINIANNTSDDIVDNFKSDYAGDAKEEIDEITNNVLEILKKIDPESIGIPANDSGDLESYATNIKETIQANLTVDQFKQLATQLETLGEEGGANLIIGLNNALSKTKDKNLINKYLGTNVKDITSITETILAFKTAGIDTTDMLQDLVNAAGGIDAFAFKDIATEAEKAQTEIDKLSESIEGLARLVDGKGSIKDVGTYIENTIKSLGMDYTPKEFSEALNDAMGGIQFTLDGIQITNAGGQIDTIIDNYKAQVENEMELAQGFINKYKDDGELSAEDSQKLENAISKAYLADAQYQEAQAIKIRQEHEREEEALKKELDLLKEKRDALKELVDWMREYNRYQNLERISDELGNDLDNLEFEIEFSTNADNIGDSLNEQLETVNRNISVNQAGRLAAQDEQAMWRDVIEKQNSDYVSFDKDTGAAIVDNKKMQELQERIAKEKAAGNTEAAETLQAEYDGIVANVEAYTNARETEQKYFKALQDNFSQLKKIQKQVLEDRVALEEKIIQVLQEQEDKELERLQKKYDAIDEENSKYLDSLQKMVDEERRIRDEAERDEDIRDKEKKLAMMKMDTSGIYASDIRSLEKELDRDYQNREDTAVDNEINSLAEEYEKEAEARQQELTYYRNYLDEKREARTEYLAEAEAIIQGGTESILNFLTTKDTEYLTGSQAQQEAYMLEWENKAARGVAASELIGSSLFNQVSTNLDLCAQSASGFDGAVTTYSQNTSTTHGNIKGDLATMTTQYGTLAEGVSGVNTKIDEMNTAYGNVETTAKRLKEIQDTLILQVDSLIGKVKGLSAEYAKIPKDLNGGEKSDFENTNIKGSDEWTSMGGWKEDLKVSSLVQDTDGTWYGFVPAVNGYVKASEIYEDDKWGEGESLATLIKNAGTDENAFNALTSDDKQWTISDNSYIYKKKYAKGGYVDYTGPAWVDGTKSHPEYMLNATQTAQFESLIDALSMVYKTPKLSNQVTANSQKTGDSHMEFHINIEGGISSDYDVDRAVERIEKKILDSGKYRNTTVIKNSN